jgi:hypothetical protein
MRHLVVAAAVAAVATLAACGGGSYTEDSSYGGGGSGSGAAASGGGKSCPGTASKGDWCARCSSFVAANTSGRCATCNGAVTSQDCCMVVKYRCSECQANHAEPCGLNDSYQCCAKLEVRSRIACSACGNSACAGDACAKCKQAGGCRKSCAH